MLHHIAIGLTGVALAAAVAADPPPLDDRIDPSRITEYEPPPLPEQVVQPMPAVSRIATDSAQVPIDAEHYDVALAGIHRGLAFLETQQQKHGAWLLGVDAAATGDVDELSPVSVAVTALAIKAFVQARPDAIEQPAVLRAVQKVLAARRPDGSFADGNLANYITSMVVSALATIDRDRFAAEIEDGVAWLTQAQWDETEGLDERQDWYGGAGYGNRSRPDMSNMQTMLEALYDAGMSPDEPAFQKASQFVSRAQNLKRTNKAAWAGDDGGFVYTPANDGESMASEHAGEGRFGEHVPEGEFRSLRSYGSMTYAGFKSLLYAGLSADDVRVRAAFDWIRGHWTFDENPGVGQQGLYYYYHAMSRALRVSQQTHITDVGGVRHDWREELIDAVLARQRPDGSWRNETDRWLEGEPVMATVYAVLALEEAVK